MRLKVASHGRPLLAMPPLARPGATRLRPMARVLPPMPLPPCMWLLTQHMLPPMPPMPPKRVGQRTTVRTRRTRAPVDHSP